VVNVRVPTILRSYASDATEVGCEPGTLREVITSLEAACQGAAGGA
jgi:hypothetical protein